MPRTDKPALVAELIASLEGTLAAARVAHAAAIEGSTHAEARAENSKDTRGLEQSYVARGQAQRVAELELAIAELGSFAVALRTAGPRTTIAIGALVTIEEAGHPGRLFVAPHGGGVVLAEDIQVVTPASPLGRALVGKQLDDEVELALPGRTRAFVIAALE